MVAGKSSGSMREVQEVRHESLKSSSQRLGATKGRRVDQNRR